MNILELSEQEIGRRESLQELRNMGIDPYPAAEFATNAFSVDIVENFEDLPFETDENGQQVKDEEGNYKQVFMSGSNGGYVKMKVTETEGPEYEWVIGNQGLNLTLVGPGQQWMDYTFITSKKAAGWSTSS